MSWALYVRLAGEFLVLAETRRGFQWKSDGGPVVVKDLLLALPARERQTATFGAAMVAA